MAKALKTPGFFEEALTGFREFSALGFVNLAIEHVLGVGVSVSWEVV